MTIVYGLLGLGLIVLIHELGHFLAAHLCGVEVETFSIGMGPTLLKTKKRKTEYRLSLLPIGGYCGMKGEQAFQNAIENNLDALPSDQSSFYGVHPFKRIIIAFGGPLANFIFAIIALSIIAGIGYFYYTTPNKIVVVNSINSNMYSLSSNETLQTGDEILSIDGKNTPFYSDISENIALNAKQKIILEIKRGTKTFPISITPVLNKETGAGNIGISPWIDPIVESTEANSGAAIAGLQKDDLITKINDIFIYNTVDIHTALKNKTDVSITWNRKGKKMSSIVKLTDGKAGISFKVLKNHTPQYNFFQAIGHGTINTFDMFGLTVKSLGLLFKGIDLTKAVSGPVRITVMLGETTENGFKEGISTGIITVLNFLAILSLSLFLMNLLPIPILDGGLILFALIEFIRKKPIKPKTISKYQHVGIIFLAFILFFALFGDITYLITK